MNNYYETPLSGTYRYKYDKDRRLSLIINLGCHQFCCNRHNYANIHAGL